MTDLAQRIKRGEVKSIEVNDDKLNVVFVATVGSATARKERAESLPSTLQPFGVTPDEISRVDIKVVEPPQFWNWLGLLVNLLPLVFFGAILLFMMRQAQGSNNQALSFGKSRARMFMGNKPTITFADVAGVEEAKQELAGSRRVPEVPGEVLGAGRPDSEGRAAGRAARHGQDAALARRRRRGGRAVLLDLRLRVRRDVRRRRRLAGARPVRSGQAQCALHRLRRRDRRGRPPARRRVWAAATTSASRR